MERIWSTLKEDYVDDVEIDLFNEECQLYVEVIVASKIKKPSTESFVSGEENSVEEESIDLSQLGDLTGFKIPEFLNDNDPHYPYALQKAFLNFNKKDDLAEQFSYGYDFSDSSNTSEDSSDSILHKSITSSMEESKRFLARLTPEYVEMVESIMFNHYNTNRIGRIRYGWSNDAPEYVMLEAVTEWKSIYPIMHDQSLFFTIHLPLSIAYIESKYPNRAKIMTPRFIVTRRAQTLNTFLSNLKRNKDLERFQVLEAMTKSAGKRFTKSFSKPPNLLENLMACVKRVDHTAIQRMAVGAACKICPYPDIVKKIIDEKNLDFMYTLIDVICGRLAIHDRTSKHQLANLLATLTKLYHLEFAYFIIQNVNLNGLFTSLTRTLRLKVPLSVMKVFKNILCHPNGYEMVTQLPDFHFEPVLNYFRNVTSRKVRLAAFRLLETILRVSRPPESNNKHKWFVSEDGPQVLTEFLQDVCDIHPLLSQRSLRLLDNLSDSVEGTSALSYIITGILWGIVKYKNPPKLKKIKGKTRRQRIKLKNYRHTYLLARSKHKYIEKNKPAPKKKKTGTGTKSSKKSNLNKLRSTIESKFKKKSTKGPRKGRNINSRDSYRRRLKRIENFLRKRRMRKLERKRQKARSKRSKRSIKRKKLIIYQDKDYHKATEMSLHPYHYPDLLKKSYKRKIKMIKIRPPPVSEKLDELIVYEITTPDPLPILENLTLLPNHVKENKYESQGFYKLPKVNASLFQKLLDSTMPTNQTEKKYNIDNTYVVLDFALGNPTNPDDTDNERKDKRVPKKNQKHVHFSDDVAILQPRSRTSHHSPVTISEEEDDNDIQSEENEYQQHLSNTKFDSTESDTTQRHLERKSSSNLTRTCLDGKEWKAKDDKKEPSPVSILKDDSTTKIFSPKFISDAPSAESSPLNKSDVSATRLRDIVKMDFINIIRTYITLSKLEEYDQSNLIKLVGHECFRKENENEIPKEEFSRRRKRGRYRRRYRKFITAECKQKYMRRCHERTIANIKGLDQLFPVTPRIIAGSDVTIASYLSLRPRGDYEFKKADIRLDDKHFVEKKAAIMTEPDNFLFVIIRDIIVKMVRRYSEFRKQLQEEHIKRFVKWRIRKFGKRKKSVIEESDAKVEELGEFQEINEENIIGPVSSSQRTISEEITPHQNIIVMNTEIISKRTSFNKLNKINFFDKSDAQSNSSFEGADDLFFNDWEVNRRLGFNKKYINDETPTAIPYYEVYPLLGYDESDKELYSPDESVNDETDETILMVETIHPPIRKQAELPDTNPPPVAIPPEVKNTVKHHKHTERIDHSKGKAAKKRSAVRISPEQAGLIEIERKKLRDRRKRRLKMRLIHRSSCEPYNTYYANPYDPACIRTASDTVKRPLFDEFGNSREFHNYPPKVANRTRRLVLELLCKLTHPLMPCNFPAGLIQLICPLTLLKSYAKSAGICIQHTITNHPETLKNIVHYYDIGYYLCRANNRKIYDLTTKSRLMGALTVLLQKSPLSCRAISKKDIRSNIIFWLKRATPYYYKTPGNLYNIQNMFYISRFFLCRDYVVSKKTVKLLVDVLKNVEIAQQLRVYASLVLVCFLFANKRYRKVKYHTKDGIVVKTLTLSMFQQPTLPSIAQYISETGHKKTPPYFIKVEEVINERECEPDAMRMFDEHLNGDIFISPSDRYHSYPYHLTLCFMMTLFFRRRPYQASVFLSRHFNEWKQWLFKYALKLSFGIRCYNAFVKSIPSYGFYLTDNLKTRLKQDDIFNVSPMTYPDMHSFYKILCYNDKYTCPSTSVYRVTMAGGFKPMFQYKQTVIEQIYDPERKSLIMPKFYPSVSPYSIFKRTKFNRERYMFYEPVSRDYRSPYEWGSEPIRSSQKALQKSVGNSVVPEFLLQSVLYSSSILYFEMMECYAAVVFRIVERAQLFDLIHYTEHKDLSFSSILSSLDIWKRNMLMDVPFHLVLDWYLKTNDTDLRFVNKYLSRFCLSMEEICLETKALQAYPHPKVLRAEKKFVKKENPIFSNYHKAAKMFFSNDKYNGARRKSFHCYFIGPKTILKNKRFKNHILSKRFAKGKRVYNYNTFLQKLMMKELYTPKPFLGYRVKKIKTSDKSDILRNYSLLYKYFNDLDNYIGFSDNGFDKCPHARSEERCYNTSKVVAGTILETFFNLLDKCSRIKEWLIKKYIPELENFFEMMLELIKVVSCKDVANKHGRRGDSWFKTRPPTHGDASTAYTSKQDDSTEVVDSSSESSTFGKLHRSFSQGRSFHLQYEKAYKDINSEKSNRRKEYPKLLKKEKLESFSTMVLLKLMTITPILNNNFLFSELSTFGNAFINKYCHETSDIQGVDFIKYRLPTEIEFLNLSNDDSEEILKVAKLNRGLSRIIVGKDRTFDKFIAFIKPPLNDSSNENTKLEGRKAVSETVVTTHSGNLLSNKSTIVNDWLAQNSFSLPAQLKNPQSSPNLLDSTSIRLSEPLSLKYQPYTLNPIIVYIMSLFSSKMFNKYKELNFLQNYLIVGKPLGKHFQKLKKADSIQIYKSRLSVIKSIPSRSSQRFKTSLYNLKIKSKSTIQVVPYKPSKREKDMKFYLTTHLMYLSGLLKSVVQRKLIKAGIQDSDDSSISSSSSDSSLQSIDSHSSDYVPSDLYKMFEAIRGKEPSEIQEDDFSSSTASISQKESTQLRGKASMTRKSFTSVGTSTIMRRVPLTMDNVTFFRMAMYSILHTLRAHILDLLNYPIENLFICLGDLRVPTLTQVMLEFYTQIPDSLSDSDSSESSLDTDETSETQESTLEDESENAENIIIDPSGSVLNIKMKSSTTLDKEYEMSNYEFEAEETEETNKYAIFQNLISEPFYCLLTPDFIDSILDIIEEGAKNGGILNPLCVNRAYYEALQRYYLQIISIVYHASKARLLYRKFSNNEIKRHKRVFFLEFLLDLVKNFVEIVNRCSSCSQFYHTFLRYLSCKVCDRLQGPFGYASSHVVHCHRRAIKAIIESSFVPLGELRIGSHLERAILFKFLADYFMIPCHLYRVGNLLTWVEVPLHPHHHKEEKYYVVDLYNDPGYLFEKDVEKLKELFGYHDRDMDYPREHNVAADIETWLEDEEEKEIKLYERALPKDEKNRSKILERCRKKQIKAEINSYIKEKLEHTFTSRIEYLDKYKTERSNRHKHESNKIDFTLSNIFHRSHFPQHDDKYDKRLEKIIKSRDVQDAVNYILAALFSKGNGSEIELSVVNKLLEEKKIGEDSISEKYESKGMISCEDLDVISNVSEWSIDEDMENYEPELVPQAKLVETKLPREPPQQIEVCEYRNHKRQKRKQKKNSLNYIRKKIEKLVQKVKRNKAHFFMRFTGSHRQYPMDHCLVKRARNQYAWGATTILNESSSDVESYSSQEGLLYEWNKQHLSFSRGENRKKISLKNCTSNVLKKIPPMREFYSKPLKETCAILIIVVKEIEKHITPVEIETDSKWTQTRKEKIHFADEIIDRIEINEQDNKDATDEDIDDDEDDIVEGNVDSSFSIHKQKSEGYSEKIMRIENEMDVSSLKKKLISLLNFKKKLAQKAEKKNLVEQHINENDNDGKSLGKLELETEEVEINPADYIKKFPGIIVIKTGSKPPLVHQSVQTVDLLQEIYKRKIGEDIITDQVHEKIKNIIEDKFSLSFPYEIIMDENKLIEIPNDVTISDLFLLDVSSIDSSSEENKLIKINKFAKAHLEDYIALNEPPNYEPSRPRKRKKKSKRFEDSWGDYDETNDSSELDSTDSESSTDHFRKEKKEHKEEILQLTPPKERSQDLSYKSYTIKSAGSESKSFITEKSKQTLKELSYASDIKKLRVEDVIKPHEKYLYDMFYNYDPEIHDLGDVFYTIDSQFHAKTVEESELIIEDDFYD